MSERPAPPPAPPGPEPGAPDWRASRTAWYAIFSGVLASCVLYRVMIGLVPGVRGPGVPSPGPLRTALYVAAAAALLGAIAWVRARLEPPDPEDGSPPEPPLPRFMAASVVGMALAEAAAAIGLVLVLTGAGAPAEYLAFGAGAFLVLVLVILPRALRYWEAWALHEGRTGMS